MRMRRDDPGPLTPTPTPRMTTSRRPLALLPTLLLLATGLPSGLAMGADRTLAEWTFDRDLQGWAANGDLADVRVADGVLHCRAVGGDPLLELRAPLRFTASPWQRLEVRLRADRDGTAEVFWSNTSEGRYGGFDQAKTTRFQVVGDGQWHDYPLLPFWQNEGSIVRLRLDLFDGASYAIDAIRAVEFATAPAAAGPRFDFDKDAAGWQAIGGAAIEEGQGGAIVTSGPAEGFVLAPPVRIDASRSGFVSIRMAVDRGASGTLLYATSQTSGLRTLGFPLTADGRERTYNLDLAGSKEWRGQVVALGLRPTDADGGRATLRWLSTGDGPQGPAQPEVVALTAADALPRVGVPTTMTAVVTNTGGKAIEGAAASLTVPPGVQVVGPAPPSASIEFGERATFQWKVVAERPVAGEAVVRVSGPAGAVEKRARLEFSPRLKLDAKGHVPEPKPVRGPFEVGAYYFPGWESAANWERIAPFPERRPVLGWYREGAPEVADWQIKWAVEHGITFFAYDWYWDRGRRHLEHALHEGYFKARYRHLLKFCLLWANHNPPKSSSYEDCLAVTRYWIEHYFKRPEHLTVGGKPVMIVFSQQRLTEDLGSPGVKRAFEAMRAECRKAGLPGLHLVACIGDAAGARRAEAEGYDAVTAYNWPGLGMTGPGPRAPFESLVPAYRRQWEQILERSALPLSPLPVCGGWDSRPWHGENNLIRFGRTPELFRRHLQDARALMETPRGRARTGGLMLVEAWNEWGEGSYIEPHQEFGFGYLDAIRDVFTSAPKAHDDATPADAGLPLLEVPPAAPPRTAWDFSDGAGGWTSMMGMTPARVSGGVLSARTTSRDPAFTSPALRAAAREFPTLTLKLRLRRADGQPSRDLAQLFWEGTRAAEGEANSVRFEVIADGQWHEHRLALAASPGWRGTINRLRLDPCTQPDVEVDVDAIGLGK